MLGSHWEAVSSSSGRSLARNRLRRCRFQKSANARLRSQTPGPGDPAVRVAPLGGERGADVVAADEADLVVDYEDLAVVPAVAAQVVEPKSGGVDGVAQHLEARREVLEPRVHDRVREGVVDHVDIHAPVGGLGQRPLEPLTDLVGLPDVGLEEDLPLRALDRGQHVVVQVLAEGVRRHRAAADLDLARPGGRERLRLLAAAPAGVDQGEPDGEQQLGAEQGQQGPPERAEEPAGGAAVAGHAANLPRARHPPPGDCRWSPVGWSTCDQ